MKKLFFAVMVLSITTSFGQLDNNVPTSGPVGIGTASPDPSRQLTVNGGSKFQGTIQIDNDMFIDGQTVMKGVVRMDSLATWAGLTNDMNILIVGPYGNVTRTTRTELMTALMEPVGLDYCGEGDVSNPQWFNGLNKLFSPCDLVNVGIGTDAPTVKLDVRGTAFATKILAGNLTGDSDATLSVYTPNHTQKLLHLAKKVGALDEEVRLSLDNDGAMELTNVGTDASITINNGAGHAIVVNDDSGNKIAQLEKSGLLRSRSVRVDLGTWADHVFAKDYNLMPLSEVKRFINENGHLPEVPDATEIENNGLDLGEMQRLQMQKIEELTLHLIQMDEQINSMQNKIDKLEAENKDLKTQK